MEHLYDAEMAQPATDALTTHFPDMTRDRGYAIRQLRLDNREQTSHRAGWKIGSSRTDRPVSFTEFPRNAWKRRPDWG